MRFRSLGVAMVGLRGIVFGVLVLVGLGVAKAQPADSSRPVESVVDDTAPAYLGPAWLRVVPPPNWRRIVSKMPGELAYETGPAQAPTATVRISTNGFDPVENTWGGSTARPIGDIGGKPFLERSDGKRRVAVTQLVTHLGETDVALRCDSDAIGQWYTAPNVLTWLAPTPGAAELVGLPLDGVALAMPKDQRLVRLEQNLAGGKSDTDGSVWLAATVDCERAEDLDAAMGPVERELERSHSLTRTSGEALNAPDAEGLLVRGHVGEATSSRRYCGWFGFESATQRLWVVLLIGSPDATATFETWWRAHGLASRVSHSRRLPPLKPSKVRLAADWADTTRTAFQLSIVCLGDKNTPLTFAGQRVDFQLTISLGPQRKLSIGPLTVRQSADLLGIGALAGELRVDATEVGAPGGKFADLAEWVVDLQLETAGVRLTETVKLVDLLDP